MSGDTLSDLLRTVRLRGAVFYRVEGASPWVAEAPRAAEIIPAIMPGVEHMFEFHAVAEGACWAALTGEPPVRMAAGDVVLFPQGDAHVMSSAPGLRAQPAMDLFLAPRPAQLPFALQAGRPQTPAAPAGADQAALVCGFLGLDARPFNPLLAALPRVLHVPRRLFGDAAWVTTFLRTATAESSVKRPGGEAVLERMSELLFVEVLRCYADSLPPEQTGWLAGMRDPIVGRALSLLHQRPADPWTIERLGSESGLSRSSLHERFVHLIGQPPMQYLTNWRMQLASARLRESDAKVVDIALDVGYESEAAFSRAFKRVVGLSPGAWRRERRTRVAAVGPNREAR